MKIRMNKKHIVLTLVEEFRSGVNIRIASQTHRYSEFGGEQEYDEDSDELMEFEPKTCFYDDETGILLCSITCPEAREDDDLFFCRGRNNQRDQELIKISKKFYERLCIAVNNYNKFYDSKEIILKENDIVYFKSIRNNILHQEFKHNQNSYVYTELKDLDEDR